MDKIIADRLQNKLSTRLKRIKETSTETSFTDDLTRFWDFIDNQPVLKSLYENLLKAHPYENEATGLINRSFNPHYRLPSLETDLSYIAFIAQVLRVLKDAQSYNQICDSLLLVERRKVPGPSIAYSKVIQHYFEPFVNYLQEKIDDRELVISFILRYKQHCEWFNREQLFDIASDENLPRTERVLCLNLYSYLHDRGIEISIEPNCVGGEIDLIAAQNTDNPLLAEAKIFDNQSRDKRYIRKVFHQTYEYAQRYNERNVYLVIFKIADVDLEFDLPESSGTFPLIHYNNKIIHFVVIDIFHHNGKSFSQRAPLKTVKISKDELIDSAKE